MRIVNLTRETEENILENMLKRSPTQYGTYEAAVSEIIAAVREKKDEAVFAYTEKFDGAKLDASTVEVTEQEIGEAYAQVDSGLVQVIRKARENILAYHDNPSLFFHSAKIGGTSDVWSSSTFLFCSCATVRDPSPVFPNTKTLLVSGTKISFPSLSRLKIGFPRLS